MLISEKMFTNLPTNQKIIKEYIFLLEIFYLNIKYCEKNLKILWNYIIVSITQHLKNVNFNSSMIEILLKENFYMGYQQLLTVNLNFNTITLIAMVGFLVKYTLNPRIMPQKL